MRGLKQTGMVMLGALLLTGCSSPDQPWAVWQKVAAKARSLTTSSAHPRFLAAAKQQRDDKPTALTLHFDFDDAHLSAEERNHLNDLVAALAKQPNGIIRLEGYTDERGSREYNVGLGWRRAKAVSQYLIQQGVAPQRLDLVSYGPEKPVAIAHNESAWRLNRRVQLAIGEYR